MKYIELLYDTLINKKNINESIEIYDNLSILDKLNVDIEIEKQYLKESITVPIINISSNINNILKKDFTVIKLIKILLTDEKLRKGNPDLTVKEVVEIELNNTKNIGDVRAKEAFEKLSDKEKKRILEKGRIC